MTTVVRWVHPAQVEADGVSLKPTAFPDPQLRKIATKSAPSVSVARHINENTVSQVQKAACDYCSRWKDTQAWADNRECRGKDKNCICGDTPYAARGATAPEHEVKTISFVLTDTQHCLCIAEDATKNNPAHAHIQSNPKAPSDLSDTEIMKLQSELSSIFRCEGPIDAVLQSFLASDAS